MRVAGALLKALLAAVATALCVQAAFAHELRPGYLDLRQMSEEVYSLSWKKPIGGEIRFEIAPVVPKGCQLTGRTQQLVTVDAAVARGTLTCSGGIAGRNSSSRGTGNGPDRCPGTGSTPGRARREPPAQAGSAVHHVRSPDDLVAKIRHLPPARCRAHSARRRSFALCFRANADRC